MNSEIANFDLKAFKVAFCVNLLLTIIMTVLLSLNFAKIPHLTNQGPLIIFIIDIISNGVWLISSILMLFTYFFLSTYCSIFHLILTVITWFLKLFELILTAILINNTNDEAILTFGDKKTTLAGISIDVIIIIPLFILAYNVKKYIKKKLSQQT